MTAVFSPEPGTVRERLIRAADDEVAERGVDGLRIETVAQRAGVSRATAFRQIGTVSELVVQVALARAQRHIDAVGQLMSTKRGTFAKLEAALVYTARELPTDPAIAALIAAHSASLRHPRVHEAAMGIMGPVLEDGRSRGEIRSDVGLDELVDFLVEQTYLAAEEIDRSEESVRRRFRLFIVAALESRSGPGGAVVSRASEAEQAIAAAAAAVDNLTRLLRNGDG